jgi:hypothetical protein
MTIIDVKTAVRKALEHVRELQDYLPKSEIRLEETEFVDPGFWQIALSFSESPFGPPSARIYKVFRIDANTGEVLSMKVQSLASTA